MRETFEDRKFNVEHAALIDIANEIIVEYQAAGFTLTLRQLYYQFVARDKIANKQSEYKRLGSIISAARLAGLVDWDAIEDRTRNVARLSTWGTPSDIMESCAHSYKEDLWEDQPFAVEVWIEKEALVGVVQGVCETFRVPYLACRGYASQSELYTAGKRFASAKRAGKKPLVLHLGDHDPSGIDMTRDNRDRLTMFARHGVKVIRLALNQDQIDLYNPPPNPAKETDSRFTGYQETHGDESWELDALSPQVIASTVEDYLNNNVIDAAVWADALAREAANIKVLEAIRDNWDDVAARYGEEDGQ